MPQVFGTDQIGLISQSTLWVEADYLDDVNEHEAALADAGFEDRVPHYLDRSGFDPRGGVWGQHLTSNKTHHTWAIARVANPQVNPNEKEFGIGGAMPRYSVEIHSVPINPDGRAKSTVTHVWDGNDIRRFLSGSGARPGQMTWPHIQRAMQSGPKK